MRVLATLVAATLQLLALSADASAAWNQVVGGASPVNRDPGADASSPSLATIGGVPHIAWVEANRVRVSRLAASGAAWEPVGEAVSAAGQIAVTPELAVIMGRPYVIWAELAAPEDTTATVRVARLSGGGWELVGGAVGEARPADAPSIADVGGRPFVAWTTPDRTVRVGRLAAGDACWEEVVAGPLNHDPGAGATSQSLTADGGDAYVAWTEWWSETQGSPSYLYLRVKRLRAGAGVWEEITPDERGLAGTESPSIVASGGTVYVSAVDLRYYSHIPEWEVRAWRLDAGSAAWEQLAVPSRHEVDGVGLTQSAGRLYLAWRARNEDKFGAPAGFPGWNTQVARLDSSAGKFVEPVTGSGAINLNPAADVGNPAITTIGGFPYVAWAEDDGENHEIRVSRLEPEFRTSTAQVLATGATLSIDMDTYGLPFEVGFEYGDDFANSTGVTATSAESVRIIHSVAGLAPAMTYAYRPFALAGVAAPRIHGPAYLFTTDPSDPPPDRAPQGTDGRNDSLAAVAPADTPALRRSRVADNCRLARSRLSARRGRRLVIRYQCTAAGKAVLRIMRAGRTLGHAEQTHKRAGSAYFKWNGRFGRTLAARGRYTVRLEFNSDGQTSKDNAQLGVR